MNEQEVEKELKEMLLFCTESGYSVDGKVIDASRLVFEERVKMNCFYCGRYNMSWKCPPRLPQIDYAKMIGEFSRTAFIYNRVSLDQADYESVRRNSSIQLHQAMLLCEKWLYLHDNSTTLSFIGGSCKLCRNGCPPTHCANPYQARVPVEALGINVVKSAQQYGIQISFPPKEFMVRLGLLLW